MKYMGSKNRIAKHILPIILKDRKEGQWYVEPFVGGANMIDKVGGNRLGADINEYLILMLKELQNGWIPPDNVSEEEYIYAKTNQPLEPLTTFIGVLCSFGGKWFRGYARGKGTNGQPRNYCLEGKKNVMKQTPNLRGVHFYHTEYQDLPIPFESIIYCDPPYEGTERYKGNFNLIGKFNHSDFWQWCREKKAEGHTIFVSEYNAPDDFKCVWEKEVNSSLTKNTGAKKATEKLFTI